MHESTKSMLESVVAGNSSDPTLVGKILAQAILEFNEDMQENAKRKTRPLRVGWAEEPERVGVWDMYQTTVESLSNGDVSVTLRPSELGGSIRLTPEEVDCLVRNLRGAVSYGHWWVHERKRDGG
jgi:hypothetical protein